MLLYKILIGYDPFKANDSLLVYQKIINNKYSFPKIIDKNAKVLIKHLLHPDVKTRYGCLKGDVLRILWIIDCSMIFNGISLIRRKWSHRLFLGMQL